MEYEYTKHFVRDLKDFKHDHLFIHLLGAKINQTIKANLIDEIDGLVLIRGTSAHYRFKIKSKDIVYRIGIKLLKKTIWFACIDNNKKRFYRRFP